MRDTQEKKEKVEETTITATSCERGNTIYCLWFYSSETLRENRRETNRAWIPRYSFHVLLYVLYTKTHAVSGITGHESVEEYQSAKSK